MDRDYPYTTKRYRRSGPYFKAVVRMADGKCRHIGEFKSQEEAHRAAMAAKQQVADGTFDASEYAVSRKIATGGRELWAYEWAEVFGVVPSTLSKTAARNGRTLEEEVQRRLASGKTRARRTRPSDSQVPRVLEVLEVWPDKDLQVVLTEIGHDPLIYYVDVTLNGGPATRLCGFMDRGAAGECAQDICDNLKDGYLRMRDWAAILGIRPSDIYREAKINNRASQEEARALLKARLLMPPMIDKL